MGLGQCGGRFYIGFHIVWFETSMVLANAVAVSISDSISYGFETSHQEVETKISFPFSGSFEATGAGAGSVVSNHRATTGAGAGSVVAEPRGSSHARPTPDEHGNYHGLD